jgi:HAD superfamily hydrolase (TIGR01509 family)
VGKIKAVLLDIDGTILLSNEAHARAFSEAAAALRVSADFDTICRLIGKGSDKLIPEAFGLKSDSDLAKQLTELKASIFKALYLPTLQPSHGARPLLERFRKEGIKIVVATSATADEVNGLLERAGVQDLIEDGTSADDVERTKPDPDVVQVALKKSGEHRSDVIMLGDTPYDVEAAHRAGIRIIAVRCGGWDDRALRGAAAVYEDPADLLVHYKESMIGG